MTPGQQVAGGQQLAQLSSIDIDLEIAKLEGRCDDYRTQSGKPDAAGFRDHRAAEQIPQMQEALSRREDQFKEKPATNSGCGWWRRWRARSCRRRSLPARRPDEKLPAWSGTPLDPENLGATLEQGVLFCQIGDPKRLEAVLVIDQADRNIVREGQSGRLEARRLSLDHAAQPRSRRSPNRS